MNYERREMIKTGNEIKNNNDADRWGVGGWEVEGEKLKDWMTRERERKRHLVGCVLVCRLPKSLRDLSLSLSLSLPLSLSLLYCSPSFDP